MPHLPLTGLSPTGSRGQLVHDVPPPPDHLVKVIKDPSHPCPLLLVSFLPRSLPDQRLHSRTART